MKDRNLNKIPYHRPIFSTYGSIANFTKATNTRGTADGGTSGNTMSRGTGGV